MKKILAAASLVFLIGVSLLPLVVNAAELCPGGNDGACHSVNGTAYICDKSVTPYKCIPDNTPAATVHTTATQSGGDSMAFVPLAPIPNLTQNADTSNLTTFFNNLYKFCIGACAVLAVIQITIGGFKIMQGDSITEHLDAKGQIGGAILGLIIVLSPFVIFSVINPNILSLKIDTTGIQPKSGDFAIPSGPNTNTAAPGQLSSGQDIAYCTDTASCVAEKNKCEARGGESDVRCIDAQGTVHPVSYTNAVIGTYACGYDDQRLAVVCTNGSGATDAAGTTNVFDGQYMDLMKFTDSKLAQSYACQANSEKKSALPCSQKNSSGACTEQYIACLTPQLNYTNVRSATAWFNPDGPSYGDKTAYDTYTKECQRIVDVLPTTVGTVLHGDHVDGAVVKCPSVDTPPAVTPPNCSKAYTTCSVIN